jgi:hypothetical protein
MKSGSRFLTLGLIVWMLVGCATHSGPRHVDLVPERAPEQKWSRVSELVPAAEIQLTIRRMSASTRYFLRADSSELLVLNLTNGQLPAHAIRVLRDMAAHHPDYFEHARVNGVYGEENIRVSRDGVFVADRKVAEFGQVVEVISQPEVKEITGPVIARGSVLGATFGAYVGFAIGVVPGLGGVSAAVAWPFLIGSVAVGGYLGFHWSSHETPGLIYRAP